MLPLALAMDRSRNPQAVWGSSQLLEFRRTGQREVALLFHRLQTEYEELRRIVNRPVMEPEMPDLARAAHGRIGALYERLAELLGETNAESIACAVYVWVLNSERL